jgi:hypothetical protein
MSDLAEQESPVPPLLRDRSGVQRVTNIELFFDLVYVFAVSGSPHEPSSPPGSAARTQTEVPCSCSLVALMAHRLGVGDPGRPVD